MKRINAERLYKEPHNSNINIESIIIDSQTDQIK